MLLAWLPKYLGEVKHFELMQIGFVAALPLLAACWAILWGLVVRHRAGPSQKADDDDQRCGHVPDDVALVYAPNDLLSVSLLLFGTGFLLNIGYSSFSPMGLTTRTTYPVAASVVNSAGQAGGAMAPLITGLLLIATVGRRCSSSWACSLAALVLCFRLTSRPTMTSRWRVRNRAAH